ncbi:MAG: aminotransferase class I/II-fold pyridoxal phosphate-dependent enzyme, partial [Lachnospiraceae bacterium]
ETYIEFTDDPAEASAVSLLADFSNLLILRGVSKFFAAPGLRLGYALCSNNSLLEEMKRRQDPWTINSLAAIAGEQMFRDSDYIARTRALIRAERTRIYRKLSKNPHLHPFVPSANFILVQIVDHSMTAADFFDIAIRRGLMIRDCASFDFLEDYYFRFCFLLPEQNDRLLACIEEAFPSGQAETN